MPPASAAPLHRCRIDLIVGTRPNIVKLGPLAGLLASAPWCDARVVFLEQHNSSRLGDDILDDLGVSAAGMVRIALQGLGYGQRLGEMVAGYANVLASSPPDLVIVFGDVDATLAAALAAKRIGLPVAHVEAGLRSHDRRMPEELNRLMVDAVADLFFTTTEQATEILVRDEGKSADHVHFVGNLMIDALVRTLDHGVGQRWLADLGLEPGRFMLGTFHRPSNVDDGDSLQAIIDLLKGAARRLPVVVPLHPRTAAALERHGLEPEIRAIPGLRLVDPIRYRDFISILALARLAITDSGGLQEETSFLGVPCLTYRENTERPVTVTHGTNRLVGPGDALRAIDECLGQPPPNRSGIPLWDGRSAERICTALQTWWRPG